MKKMNMRKGMILALAGVMVVALTGCGKSASSTTVFHEMAGDSAASEYYSYDDMGIQNYYDYGMTEEYAPEWNAEMESPAEGTTAQVMDYSQKLIRTYNFSYETLAFEDSVAYVNAKVAEYGGYIESSETYGRSSRYAYFTVRIPDKNANAFLNDAGQIGEIISKSESTEDITLTYYDTAARLETLHTQHDRLLELLSTAATLEDIVQLERELSDVEYEINSYQSILNSYDNRVNYVTMHIDISEVAQIQVIEEDGFFTELKKELSRNTRDVIDSLLDMVIAVIAFIPYLIVIAVAALVVLLIVLAINKKSKKRLAKKLDK